MKLVGSLAHRTRTGWRARWRWPGNLGRWRIMKSTQRRDTGLRRKHTRPTPVGTGQAQAQRMVNIQLQPLSRDYPEISEFWSAPIATGVSPAQFNSQLDSLTMLPIVAKSSSRCLPPLTLALRSFSSSAATRQAVPTEAKPLNKDFKIYRWVLSSLLFRPVTILRSPLSRLVESR